MPGKIKLLGQYLSRFKNGMSVADDTKVSQPILSHTTAIFKFKEILSMCTDPYCTTSCSQLFLLKSVSHTNDIYLIYLRDLNFDQLMKNSH